VVDVVPVEDGAALRVPLAVDPATRAAATAAAARAGSYVRRRGGGERRRRRPTGHYSRAVAVVVTVTVAAPAADAATGDDAPRARRKPRSGDGTSPSDGPKRPPAGRSTIWGAPPHDERRRRAGERGGRGLWRARWRRLPERREARAETRRI